jgi:metal-dependent HD superfamily phosphatase/phosphodiesterase
VQFLVSFEKLRKDAEIQAYIKAADGVLDAIGFTEHGLAHACKTGEDARRVLETLGYDEHTCELARISGLLHDIGNTVNRTDHAQSGALLASDLLRARGLDFNDVIAVTTAIGHHDDKTAAAVTPVAAALILADKSDVRRTRVRREDTIIDDIHDRVNYAVTGSSLKVDPEEKKIALNLQVDESICTMYEYFDIFLGRMMMCRGAAEMLGAKFRLTVNGGKVL